MSDANLDHVKEFLTVITAHDPLRIESVEGRLCLQLSRLHPTSARRIDDVDRMVRAAMTDCSTGHNVYLEARTVRADLNGNGRGGLKDTVGVFALVVDSDNDKGMGWSPLITPSMTVETSPGNFQFWFFHEHALDPETGNSVGERVRKAVKADHDTGAAALKQMINTCDKREGRS
jgi:hypothetical protein